MSVLRRSFTIREIIFGHIDDERTRQDQKWGFPQNNSPTDWTAILTEEVGEAAQEALAVRFGELAGTKLAEKRQLLREELVQVAAVAVGWIEHMDLEDANV